MSRGADHLPRPAGAEQVLRLSAPGMTPHDRRAPGLPRAQEQHVAGVAVRRTGLGVEVVAVVPDRDQADLAQRREGRGAGADHDPGRSALDSQERRVALRRPGVGGEHDVVPAADQRRERVVEPGHVAVVGHAQQGAAAGPRGGDSGLGEQGGPVVTGQAGPDRAGRPARGEGVQQGGSPVVRRPAGEVGGGKVGGGGARLLLGGGVAGRDREPEHVGPGAGPAGGDLAGERGDLGRQHRLGAHHAAQRHQPARMGGLGGAGEHEPVDVLPGEPHLHPDARHRVVGHRVGHQVVERAVEVGQRYVDQHLRDRVDLGRPDRRLLLRWLRAARLGTGQPGQRELLLPLVRGGVGLGHGTDPTSRCRRGHGPDASLWTEGGPGRLSRRPSRR